MEALPTRISCFLGIPLLQITQYLSRQDTRDLPRQRDRGKSQNILEDPLFEILLFSGWLLIIFLGQIVVSNLFGIWKRIFFGSLSLLFMTDGETSSLIVPSLPVLHHESAQQEPLLTLHHRRAHKG